MRGAVRMRLPSSSPRAARPARSRGFRWRKRGGQPAFRTARKAEASEDWAAVADDLQARRSPPIRAHLEAAWLLAVALAKLGSPTSVLAPLVTAVAGDFGKWALASLDSARAAAVLATPTGQAWRRASRRIARRFSRRWSRGADRDAHGDLFASIDETPRFRATHAHLRRASSARSRSRAQHGSRTSRARQGRHELGVGIVDLGAARRRARSRSRRARRYERRGESKRHRRVRIGKAGAVLDDDDHHQGARRPQPRADRTVARGHARPHGAAARAAARAQRRLGRPGPRERDPDRQTNPHRSRCPA